MQTAVRYQVPLIIWGAHQGLEQVGMFSHEHEVEMTRRYRKDHDLMGREADDLISLFDTLRESDVWQYRYPEDGELATVGVRGIYLGNYVRWDPLAQHHAMIASHGYQGAAFARSFDTFDHVDCWNFLDLHDAIKRLKHGYWQGHRPCLPRDPITGASRASRVPRSCCATRTGPQSISTCSASGSASTAAGCSSCWTGTATRATGSSVHRGASSPRRRWTRGPRRAVWRWRISRCRYGQAGRARHAAASTVPSRRYITFGKGYPL